MNSILVTGADGFIGKNLVTHLRNANFQIHCLDKRQGDISKESTWDGLPKTDVLIHLAGKSFVPDSWKDIDGYVKSNLLGTMCALKYCTTYDAKLIYLSSYMYGNPSKLPVSESAKIIINNPYALSKKYSEEACAFYSRSFNTRVVVLRLFNVYGYGQADYFFIPMILKQIILNKKITVKDLEPKRDYIYIADVVSAIISSIGYECLYEIFNIGFGRSYSIAEVIDELQKVMGTNIPVVNEMQRRKGEIMDCFADIRKAQKFLSWSPQFSLNKGLHDIINTVNKTKINSN